MYLVLWEFNSLLHNTPGLVSPEKGQRDRRKSMHLMIHVLQCMRVKRGELHRTVSLLFFNICTGTLKYPARRRHSDSAVYM